MMTDMNDDLAAMEDKVEALTAENARLRGEVETTQAILDEMMVRHNRISALETDLARVTVERDRLRVVARAVVNTVGNLTRAVFGQDGFVAVCALLNLLDEQRAACAPPASYGPTLLEHGKCRVNGQTGIIDDACAPPASGEEG
jgi:hypothetical protein